jgi:hypothetical protein
MRRRLEAHLYWYSHARTHHALGGLLVPADRYYGRVAEVLARIEAGAGREVGDGIGSLPGRALALVVEWGLAHRDELRENWVRLERGEPLCRIEPLE